MKTCEWSFRGPEVSGRAGASRMLVCAAAVLVLVGLLLCGVSACGGASDSNGDPHPDLSTVPTTSVQTTSTAAGSGTTEAASTSSTAGSATTSTVVGMELGTRRNPIPLGQEAQVGDWKIKVVDAVLDATKMVADANMFNKAPEPGNQYVLVTIEATYIGEESSTFWVEMMYHLVGSKGNTFDSGMVVVPDSILDEGEVFSGGTISGNLVFIAESAQVRGGTLMLEEFVNFGQSRVFFAIE
jgi:hypothetical protein